MATLEQAPNGLNGVRVNVALDPFLAEVVDVLVARVLVSNAPVGPQGVRVDGLRVVRDNIVQRKACSRALLTRSVTLTRSRTCPPRSTAPITAVLLELKARPPRCPRM